MKCLITILLSIGLLTGCVSSQQRESFSHIKPLVIGQKFNPDAIKPLPEIIPLEEPALNYEVAVVVRDVPMLQHYSQEDLRCLARNIYFEARAESERGQVAVAYVTMNRVADSRFPKNICAVVHQRFRGVCQFSWVCDKRNNVPSNREAYAIAERIALDVLHARVDNPIGNRIFFHSTRIFRDRSYANDYRIGGHRFHGKMTVTSI